MDKLPDIYFTPEYGRLYEKHEHGTLEVFTFENERGKVYCQFMKRMLLQFPGYEEYSDIITPYGYGGPIILECKDGARAQLVSDFHDAFSAYCLENKIVSFFIRFHPLFHNAEDFTPAFDDVRAIRKVIAVDLTKDVFNEELSKEARKRFRQAEKIGLQYEYDHEYATLETFQKMYYGTMDKNHASDYYYFSRDYFEQMKLTLGDAVEYHIGKLNGEVIHMLITLCYGDFMYTHLSATTKEGYKFSASEFVKTSCAIYASRRGFKKLFMGGGVTNSPDDTLFKFKRKFTQSEPIDFYVGKHICNHEVYDALCRLNQNLSGADAGSDYFPLYRA